jgi:hypothetical protein
VAHPIQTLPTVPLLAPPPDDPPRPPPPGATPTPTSCSAPRPRPPAPHPLHLPGAAPPVAPPRWPGTTATRPWAPSHGHRNPVNYASCLRQIRSIAALGPAARLGLCFLQNRRQFFGRRFQPVLGSVWSIDPSRGGHSATYDNSVLTLDFNDLTFKRLSMRVHRPLHMTCMTTRCSTMCTPSTPMASRAPVTATTRWRFCRPMMGVQPRGFVSYAPPVTRCIAGFRAALLGASIRSEYRTCPRGSWIRWSANGPTTYRSPGACSAYDPKRKTLLVARGPIFTPALHTVSRRRQPRAARDCLRVAARNQHRRHNQTA